MTGASPEREYTDRVGHERERAIRAAILHQLRLLTHGGKVVIELDVATGGVVSGAQVGHRVRV